MPVPVQTTFTASTANGVSTSFPYAFKITDADDLEVSVDGVVITTGFTVTGVGDELGGSVDFTVAPTNGAKVLRALSPILKREADYQQFGDWSSSEVDADFDRIWLALQALSQNTSRSLKLPKDTADDQVLTEDAAARTGMLVSFDASGNMTLVASADVSLTTVSAFASTLLDDADAAAARATLGAIGASDAVSFASSVALAADISPAQITANQNDYNPTGLSTASVLRLNTDASRDITGLQGGADGRLIVITNIGSFAIVLKDESASSTAANRFALAADITLATDQSVVLQYDSTSSRWRAVALPAGAAGAAGDVQTFNAGGTWTKPASGTMALIEVWGAGGGGARRSSGNSTGGAGGGYSLLWKKLSDLGATETVTIGAGGLAQSTDSTSGNNGGVTSFGAHISHVGGTGGDQVAAASNTASPHAGGVGAVQGISTNTSARSGANSAAAITSAALTAYPMGTAGQPASVPAADAVCVTPLPCFMGGGCGGNVSTVLNAQSNGATSTYGGAGGNGNKAGSGSAGTQPGGGGGAGTTQGGAGGDGRVKVSVF